MPSAKYKVFENLPNYPETRWGRTEFELNKEVKEEIITRIRV
mgnify:FL=1|jgi:hypothetical protein